jgi:hypothetical protein
MPRLGGENLYGKIRVKIKGLTPLLMNRLTPEKLKRETRVRTEDFDPEVDARESAYIDVIGGKQQLYIPAEAVYGMIVTAAAAYKSGKMSLSNLLAGTIRIEPEKIPLGTDKYEIDIRPVRVPPGSRTASRVLRARAKVPTWEAEFTIIYDKKMLGKVIGGLRKILEDAGRRVGLLDFRPQKRGWFGTFAVEEFKILE